MTGGQEQGLVSAIAIGVTMLALTIRLRLLRLPELTTRCGACRRRVRRGTACPCARARD
jgi:hypothetical protein